MEFILELAIKFWMWTVVIVLIIIGLLINIFDKKQKTNLVNFKYKDYPHMKPIKIGTAGKGFWSAIIIIIMMTATNSHGVFVCLLLRVARLILVSVSFHMQGQVVTAGELSITEMALERLLAGVFAKVSRQLVGARKLP